MERAAAAASSFDPSPPAEPSIPREPPASARDWDRSIQDLAAQLQDFNDTAKEASSTDAVWSAEPDAIEEPEQLHPEIDWSNSSWPSEDDWPEDVKKAI